MDSKEYMYHILFISMLQGWIVSLKNALHNQFFKEFDPNACFALIYLIASPFLYETKEGDEVFPITKLYPLFFDKENSAGSAYGGYFWQDLYVAQRIFKNNPRRHVDVGSRIDGFVAHVATFRSIEVIDVRPLKSIIPNVRFTQLDITNCNKEEITDSISCLHAMEHFGLGRYGDTICYNGHVIGLRNITRMLKSRGGYIYPFQ